MKLCKDCKYSETVGYTLCCKYKAKLSLVDGRISLFDLPTCSEERLIRSPLGGRCGTEGVFFEKKISTTVKIIKFFKKGYK